MQENCILFLHLPDIAASRKSYRSSALRQVLESAEMRSVSDVLLKTLKRALCSHHKQAEGEKQYALIMDLATEKSPASAEEPVK